MEPNQPQFSVIIPTRNRSDLMQVALNSVLEQRHRDFEVIIVNDGSSEEHESRYRELLAAAPASARLLSLIPTQSGHGPSHARNYGAAHARGTYLCFLDDDDQWNDPEHLGRLATVITGSAEPIDLMLAKQQAFRNGTYVAGTHWIEDLDQRLSGVPDTTGAFWVTLHDLLSCQAHCHLNTTIARRPFFVKLGGFDEGLLYEEDRDFYLRAIDHARLIRFLPFVVSRHNIPVQTSKENASTVQSELAKRLYQLRVFDKAALLSVNSELRNYAMRQRIFILKHIAIEAARLGRFDCATYYAKQALVAGFTARWLGATMGFAARRWLPAVKLSPANKPELSTECDSAGSGVLIKPIE
jgi:glycosyltransferase involved in cell wall biosynthesis